MTYQAVVDARKAAEARSGNVREAVRLGFEMKKALDDKKRAQAEARAALSTATPEKQP